VGAFVVTAVVMLATEPSLTIGWDEGYTLGREARLRDWFRALRDPVGFSKEWRPPELELVQQERDRTGPPSAAELNARAKLLFDRRVVGWFWPFAREEPHGHPPFYALLGLIGDVLAPGWPDLPRARLGPILLFSFTSGVIFAFFMSRFNAWAAILAAGSWVFQPNLFGHGHYAAYDGVLASLWILAIIVFAHAVIPPEGDVRPRFPWGWSSILGLIAGCAAATKLTGWFLPVPFLAWALFYRSANGLKTLVLATLIGFVVLLALVPPWWGDPVGGIVRFLDSNLNRAKTIPIEVQFLNHTFNTPRESLPYYNTLVWTLFVTPVGFLLFGGIGIYVALRYWRTEPLGLLLVGHWAFLVLLRALPRTPGHDGVRLFLPAFGVLALLGGLGAKALLDRSWLWAKPAIALAFFEGPISIALLMPVPLSYYSPLVGGLPGATALGMEPTYYWDALDQDARHWLSEHTPPGRTIVFRTFPTSWLYLRSTGELPRRLAPVDSGVPLWLVLQNRPGAFSPADRRLVQNGRPAYTVSKLGVPLVWIFPYSELARVSDTTREEEPPSER
jgi:4-amino-4-deoxy-L-arabinose transferase-like glycosyltransferase